MSNLNPWRKGPMSSRHPLEDLRRDLTSLVDRFRQGLSEGLEPWFDRQRFWGLDVRDEGQEMVVEAEAPGFEAEDFDIEIRSHHLIIKAERQEETTEKQVRSLRVGHFERAVPVPSEIDASRIQATYKNGVLEVRLPRSGGEQRTRIPVQKA